MAEKWRGRRRTRVEPAGLWFWLSQVSFGFAKSGASWLQFPLPWLAERWQVKNAALSFFTRHLSVSRLVLVASRLKITIPAHFQLASLPLADKLPPMSAVTTQAPGDHNSYRKIRVFVASPGDVATDDDVGSA